jgi:predicted RNA-binding Zn ribbon-like protein
MEVLCLDFLNSDWHDYRGSGRHEDHLEQASWIEGFLQRWQFPALPMPDHATRVQLKTLRDHLRGLLERVSSGEDLTEADLGVLNEALGAAALRRQVTRGATGYRLQAMPIRRDWTWIEAEIAASCAELITQYEPARVKFCQNPDCRWAFYDESRPGSRRWCEDTCASLIKVRRFRARQKEQDHTHQARTGSP